MKKQSIMILVLSLSLLFSWSCRKETETKSKKKELPVKFEKFEAEIADAEKDTLDKDNKSSAKNPFIDIIRNKISLEKDQLHIIFEMKGPIPDKTSGSRATINYQILIDEDKDTLADYLVGLDIDSNGSIPKFSNLDDKSTKTGEKFPGTYSKNEKILEFYVDTDQIDSPELFDWLAFVIYEDQSANGSTLVEKDLSPDGALDDVSSWNHFPLE